MSSRQKGREFTLFLPLPLLLNRDSKVMLASKNKDIGPQVGEESVSYVRVQGVMGNGSWLIVRRKMCGS